MAAAEVAAPTTDVKLFNQRTFKDVNIWVISDPSAAILIQSKLGGGLEPNYTSEMEPEKLAREHEEEGKTREALEQCLKEQQLMI